MHPPGREWPASFRVAQGRLEEAEHLLRGHEDLPETTQAVVALQVARGQTSLAAALLHRRLNELGRDNLLSSLCRCSLSWSTCNSPSPMCLGPLKPRRPFSRSPNDRRTPGGLPRGELALGAVCAADADARSARRHLDSSLGLFVQLRMPHGPARVHFASARALADRDAGAAVEEARQALRTFEDLGASHDADEVAAFLRDHGVAGRTGPKLVGESTKREVEVLRLLGEGLTNAEIAARLFISTKTVAKPTSATSSRSSICATGPKRPRTPIASCLLTPSSS